MKSIKIKTLEKGYQEVDDLILHFCFQVFVNFIDNNPDWKDCSGGNFYEDNFIKSTAELLYDWWTVKRPNRKDPFDDKKIKHPKMKWEKIPGTDCFRLLDYDHNKFHEYDTAMKWGHILEVSWQREDQEMLLKLISIREYLWY